MRLQECTVGLGSWRPVWRAVGRSHGVTFNWLVQASFRNSMLKYGPLANFLRPVDEEILHQRFSNPPYKAVCKPHEAHILFYKGTDTNLFINQMCISYSNSFRFIRVATPNPKPYIPPHPDSPRHPHITGKQSLYELGQKPRSVRLHRSDGIYRPVRTIGKRD